MGKVIYGLTRITSMYFTSSYKNDFKHLACLNEIDLYFYSKSTAIFLIARVIKLQHNYSNETNEIIIKMNYKT